MKATGNKDLRKAKANIPFRMDLNMMETGKMMKKMDKEFFYI